MQRGAVGRSLSRRENHGASFQSGTVMLRKELIVDILALECMNAWVEDAAIIRKLMNHGASFQQENVNQLRPEWTVDS